MMRHGKCEMGYMQSEIVMCKCRQVDKEDLRGRMVSLRISGNVVTLKHVGWEA